MIHPKDDYGVLGNKMEVDSDVNEDRGREVQLDDSFEAWYGNIEDQVKRKLDITNVPQSSVFDAAIGMDEDQTFSELDEFSHERNEVAAAQKQVSSQETTGTLDQ